MIKYFKGVTNLEELKKKYRELVKIHHPDKGGNPEIFKQINNEYSELCDILLESENTGKKEEYKTTKEQMEKFKDVINLLTKYEGLEIEITGTWLWVSGNTTPIKEILKQNGFYWASAKFKWYLKPDNYTKKYHKPLEMDKIRMKYGSNIIKTENKIKIG